MDIVESTKLRKTGVSSLCAVYRTLSKMFHLCGLTYFVILEKYVIVQRASFRVFRRVVDISEKYGHWLFYMFSLSCIFLLADEQ